MQLAHINEQEPRVSGRRPDGEGARSGARHHGDKHGERSERFFYSPNEVALIGASASGKFVEELLAELSRHHRVAHVRRQSAAGSGDGATGRPAIIHVADGPGYSLRSADPLDEWNRYELYNEVDLVLIEAENDAELPRSTPKILFLNEPDASGDTIEPEGPPTHGLVPGEPTGIIAYATGARHHGEEETERRERGILPILDSGRATAAFLTAFFEDRAAPLYGLVLGGGRSTRMKRDKGAIAYRGEPQVRYAYHLLEKFCDRVFVSNRSEQHEEPLFEGLNQIHDRFLDLGPMGGMLSAFHTHPEAAWLVLGCDLPFVNERTLRELVSERDSLMLATCYLSEHDGLPEPLCAVYEPRYRRRLHQFLGDGRDCPRKSLINSRAKRLRLADPSALENINSPVDFERAVKQIRREKTRDE